MDVGNPADEEENERKLLADTSDDELEKFDDEKIDDENKVLDSDSGDEEEKQEDDSKVSIEDEDSDEDDDQDMANEAAVQAIETTLANNPYDYEAHKMLIEKLHSMAELERLRIARENMSSKYPLTPEIWLSWLRDEMKIAVTPEQKMAIMELCEKAVQDYLCETLIFLVMNHANGFNYNS